MISDLNEIPVIAAYLRRIGAVGTSFKSATITEMVGNYPLVVGSVRFTPEGHVICFKNAAAPTDAEAVMIREAYLASEFPKPVTVTSISSPPPDCDPDDALSFICHDIRGQQIVMIHQRYESNDGKKGFLPWTRWSDGRWRKMEPEVIPFHNTPSCKDRSTLYIHEGPKSSKRIQRMIDGLDPVSRFPWFEEMRHAAHVGWIGGIHNWESSDWDGLSRLQSWSRVIIVPDNDPGGREVVPKISKFFKCPTFVMMFTDEWPRNFDLGDDWPAKLFGAEGQYIGNSHDACLQPATWATDEFIIEPETPNGRPRVEHSIRPIFAEQWSWIEGVDQMVCNTLPNFRMAASKFNGFIRPFSDIKDTFGKFQIHFSGNPMTLTYNPANPGKMIRDEKNLMAINMYQPSPIKPTQGDYTPWIEFMEYLIPKDIDRAAVLRWIATLSAYPATRIVYGILLMSERQGIGKGTLGRILAALVGRDNASFPGESMIVNSEFNGWLSGKRLIVVDEIYSGHSWKAYNKLKPYVSDDTIEINVKFEATWSMPNWTHYLLMSNSRAALKLEATDRRWLVPEVQEVPWSADKFLEFNDWLDGGGMAYIAWWARTFEERGEGRFIRKGETSPMTANKQRLIGESRSDAESLLINLAEEMAQFEGPIALVLADLKSWAADRLTEKVFESAQGIGRLMRLHGLFVTDRVKIGGQKQTLICNKEEMQRWEPDDLRAAVKTPSAIIPETF